jgi:glycine C-acetyltransferase/8-amino-7-oxononanoate synthase
MYREELERIKKAGLYRFLRRVESAQGPYVTINGKPYLLMAGNNYLGLANHPKVREAAIEAIHRYGVGAGASRLISGNMALHEELEERLARFKGTEAALIFSTGYMANLSLLSSLLPEDGLILLDRLCHASLIDGARLSGHAYRVYGHRDLTKLTRLLENKPQGQPALIVTDGVFSMDGDITPLPRLIALAREYGARVLIDDAHATGVLGTYGRGTLEHFGISPTDENVIQMGTLGKAIGTFGAYVVGSRDLREYLINKARAFIYTTALPPAVCAAGIAALELIEKEPELRTRLWQNRNHLHQGLRSLHFDTLGSETPILPIIISDSDIALRWAELLFEEGILAPAIRPPTVPKGTSRIRMTVMADHTKEDLNRVLEILERGQRNGT